MGSLIKRRKNFRRVISVVLMLVVLATCSGIEQFATLAYAQVSEITIYLKDNTENGWISKDDAIIEAVDNTTGHDHYSMVKVNDTTWSIRVPNTATNFTFNRLSSDGKTQWNSWSAGGRDNNNTYVVDGSEYGHWEDMDEILDEKYFHAGDIVYLDLTEFTEWKNNDAILYVNFSNASKEDNGEADIEINNADTSKYNPKNVDIEVAENVYAYVVGFEDQYTTELRFWRGDSTTLWNCSIVLTYEDYINGLNCVKVKDWDDNGELSESENEMDIKIDSDGDGLADYYEFGYNTDINNVDTDGDGLTDYQEIDETGTSPLNIDTDGNGVLDPDEDADGEGLTNIEEYRLGTSNLTVDTDFDGLTDYEEVYEYYTNPNEKDTDGDGADDEWEIINKFDPLVYNDSFIVNEVIEGKDTRVEIELVADGDSAASFQVNTHENDEKSINATIPGYLGSGYDFYIDGQFSSATIKYYFNIEEAEEEDFNPVVYYLNEDTNELEEIPTKWDGTSDFVTAQLPHFSTYLLLNKTKFDEIWNKKIKIGNGESSNLNVAFAVDLSGSMSGSKLTTTKVAINSFLDILEENDRAGLISFSSNSQVRSNLTTDISSLKDMINNMYASGGTAIYTGLNSAVEMLVNDDANGYDMIIVLTDGYDSPSTTYDKKYKSIVDKAVENHICVYTIGIGQVDTGLLTKIAQATGGNYYHASVVSELEEKINEVKEEAKDLTEDSNGDGITDYHTKLICDGSLRYSTGAAVMGFVGNYELIQENDDYDGDGLLNGEEISVGSTSGGRPCVVMMSKPADKDTDNDGYNDKEEKENGTNVFYPDIKKDDVNALFNDCYLASVFADDYENDYGTRALLFTGNLFTNFKYSYVDDYRKALIMYIQQYTEATYQDKRLKFIKDIYDSSLFSMLEEGTNYLLSLSDVVVEEKHIADYNELRKSVAECCIKIDLLRSDAAELDSFGKVLGYNDELYEGLLIVEEKIAKQEQLLLDITSEQTGILNSMKFNVKFVEATGKLVNKLPSPVVKLIKKLCDENVNTSLTYGLIALDTGVNVLDSVSIYGGFDAGLMQCAEVDGFLDSIIENSDLPELREAAADVKDMLEDDYEVIYNEVWAIGQDIGEGIVNALVNVALTSTGPFGWATSLGWGLGNLLSGTGSIDEKALSVIVYGNGAKCYSESIQEHLSSDTSDFYMCTEELKGQLQLLGQLKIVGEDKFCETANCRGPLRKLFEYIISDETQESLDEYGRDNIDSIVSACDNMSIFVEKIFDENYLYA